MIKVPETVEKYKNVQNGIARIHLASIKYPVINKSFFAVMLRYNGQRFECDGKGNLVKACYKALRFCEKQKIKNVTEYDGADGSYRECFYYEMDGLKRNQRKVPCIF